MGCAYSYMHLLMFRREQRKIRKTNLQSVYFPKMKNLSKINKFLILFCKIGLTLEMTYETLCVWDKYFLIFLPMKTQNTQDIRHLARAIDSYGQVATHSPQEAKSLTLKVATAVTGLVLAFYNPGEKIHEAFRAQSHSTQTNSNLEI